MSPRGCTGWLCAVEVINIAFGSEAIGAGEGDENSFSPLSRDPLLCWPSACGCALLPKEAPARDLAESAEEGDGKGAPAAACSSTTAAAAAMGVTPMGSTWTALSRGTTGTAIRASKAVVCMCFVGGQRVLPSNGRGRQRACGGGGECARVHCCCRGGKRRHITSDRAQQVR